MDKSKKTYKKKKTEQTGVATTYILLIILGISITIASYAGYMYITEKPQEITIPTTTSPIKKTTETQGSDERQFDIKWHYENVSETQLSPDMTPRHNSIIIDTEIVNGVVNQ